MFLCTETMKGCYMQIDKNLLSVICKISNISDLNDLFEELFTTAELSDLNLRWKLMKDLYSGMPQRKISEKYGISLCKITRGSKVLKKENSSVLKILNELQSVEEK
jgi:TrpR family transcriptional regulator, trp operon repressor